MGSMSTGDAGHYESEDPLGYLGVLRAYLSLDSSSSLCLDLRPTSSFQRYHLAHATHIDTFSGLAQRFSTLPPRHVPLLVICEEKDEREVRRSFGGGVGVPGVKRERIDRVLIGGTIVVCPREEEEEKGREGSQDPPEPETSLAAQTRMSTSAFWQAAKIAGIVRSSGDPGDSAGMDRLASSDDYPRLLGSPSPVVERAITVIEAGGAVDCEPPSSLQKRTLRLLDLGSGAGRDLVWVCYRSAERQQRDRACRKVQWDVVGIDNLKPALERTHVFLRDFGVDQSDRSELAGVAHSDRGSSCLALVAAEVLPSGRLVALPPSGKPSGSRGGASLERTWYDGKVLTPHVHLQPPSEDAASSQTAWQVPQTPEISANADLLAFAQDHLPFQRFDVILMIRFLPRPLFPLLPLLLHDPGIAEDDGPTEREAWIVISHFYHGHPSASSEDPQLEVHPDLSEAMLTGQYENPNVLGRIRPGEMESVVAAWNAMEEDAEKKPGERVGSSRWEIVSKRVEPIEDGRPVWSGVIRRFRINVEAGREKMLR